MNLTRNELAAQMSKRLGCTRAEAKKLVSHFVGAMTDALLAGARVEFRGFGALEIVNRKSKVGRNPKSPDETYNIPSRRVVKFKTGKDLYVTLNEKKR